MVKVFGMFAVLIGIGIMLACGAAAAGLGRRPRAATIDGAGGAVAGCVFALPGACRALLSGGVESLRLPWAMPFGSCSLELDALGAFFLILILALSALAAVYGSSYLKPYWGRKAIGAAWAWYNLLAASMAALTLARNGLLFLTAWEVMALASFFLVGFEDEKEQVREAAWTYLIATHLGSAFIVALFLIMGVQTGSFEFSAWGAHRWTSGLSGLLFLFAVIGFGTKAGFMPFHVWLPEAHPAAPSHVSALMSGVMIKTGIYGLLRMLTLLGPAEAWWGWTLLMIGLAGGTLGILFALAQKDIKRLLAYSSVENVGIIAVALGLALIGVARHKPALAALGFAAALMHALNHAMFKGLLFMAAGAVAHATGTREMDGLGGLMKRMPRTGAMWTLGAAAISGLPPLNGFTGEFLTLLAALAVATGMPGPLAAPGLLALVAVPLIAGLALAAFAKTTGAVFLGEPRGETPLPAHEAGLAMRIPMMFLAAACVVCGLGAPWLLRLLTPVIRAFPGISAHDVGFGLGKAAVPLAWIVLTGGLFLGLIALLAVIRRGLLGGREVSTRGTWDCGYAQPTARMQYTASSFTQPLVELFHAVVRSRRRLEGPSGVLPSQASFHTTPRDAFTHKIFRPAFEGLRHTLGWMRIFQQGRVQLYVLYVALTLAALLVWFLGWQQ